MKRRHDGWQIQLFYRDRRHKKPQTVHGEESRGRRQKVILADIKEILCIVLVCDAEDEDQCFDIVDKRNTSRVDGPEEYLERFWCVTNVDGEESPRVAQGLPRVAG